MNSDSIRFTFLSKILKLLNRESQIKTTNPEHFIHSVPCSYSPHKNRKPFTTFQDLRLELIYWPVQKRKLWCSSAFSPSQLRKAVVYHMCSHTSRSEAISVGIQSTPQSTHDLSSPRHAVPQIQQLGSIMWNSSPTHRTFHYGFLQKKCCYRGKKSIVF